MGIRHLGLKFLSIGLAAVLWLIVSGEQIVERALRIPLEYTNLPRQLEMTGDPPTVVDVRVRGSSSALSRLAQGELVAVLDLRSARAGRRLFHLTPGDIRAPFGVDVIQVMPSNVAMLFEESASKVVPVVPAVEGEPADGFVIGTISADPATVEVVGPGSVLAELTEAITEPVSVEGAAAAVRESVNIGLPDPAIRLRAPQSSLVTVQIEAVPIERVVADVSVQARGTTAVPRPSRVKVTVRGGQEQMNELKVSGLHAWVDVAGLSAGEYRLPVQVSAPSRVTIVTVDPAEVQVNVGK